MTSKFTQAPINYYSVKYYTDLLQRTFDGSKANKASRDTARAYLKHTANVFRGFAEKNPNSSPANYLNGFASHLEEIINISKLGE